MAWTFYNASGEAMIIDGGVSASAAVFTGNAALGSNLLVGNGGSTGLSISSIGIVQMAAQPAFFFKNNAVINNVTGNNTEYTGVFTTEVANQGDNFDGTSTFTAPVTGLYRFDFGCSMYSVTASATRGRLRIVTPNRKYEAYWHPGNNEVTTDVITFCQLHVLADVDATEAVTCTVLVNGMGSDMIEFGGAAAEVTTWFSGELVV